MSFFIKKKTCILPDYKIDLNVGKIVALESGVGRQWAYLTRDPFSSLQGAFQEDHSGIHTKCFKNTQTHCPGNSTFRHIFNINSV